MLSFENFRCLRSLEDKVLECNLDGPENQSEAFERIMDLNKLERELNVFRVDNPTPSYRDYHETMNRLNRMGLG